MDEYPFEGDLLAVYEAVAVPRIVDETFAVLCGYLGVPSVSCEVNKILSDADWRLRMTYRRSRRRKYA